MPWLINKLRDSRRGTAYWLTNAAGALIVLVGIVVLRTAEHPWKGTTGLRISKGIELMASDYLCIYGYWTGVANVVLLSLLLLTSRWWWPIAHPFANGKIHGVLPPPACYPDALRTARRPRWSILCLLVVVVIAGAIRLPQLQRSIMRDEQDTLRYSIHGYHEWDAKLGEPVFRRVTWAEAGFGNRKGNNPILLSLTSKASLELWQKLRAQPEDVFSPVALRFPVFLAGLASVVAIWWLTGLIGPRFATWPAVLAALLAAVHPLHIEYSVQARGYGFVMLGAALAMGCALTALRYGRWRDWIGLGLGFLITLYAFLGGMFFVTTLAVTLAVYLLLRLFRKTPDGAGAGPEVRAALVRYAVVGLVTLGVYAQLALPAAVQMLNNEGLASFRNPLGLDWWFAAYTEMTSGALFLDVIAVMRDQGGTRALTTMMRSMATQEPLYFGLIFGVFPLLVAAGLRSCWRHGIAMRLVIGAASLAPLVMFLHHRLVSHRVLMVWYLIFALPALIVLLVVGLDSVAIWLSAKAQPLLPRVSPAVLPGLIALVLAGFIWQTGPWFYFRNPQQRATVYPHVCYARGSRNWVIYPNGVSASFPLAEQVPDQFPWPVPVAKVINGVTGNGKVRALR